MSWGVTVKGNADAIGEAFEAERQQKESHGAPAGELENISEAGEFAVFTADAAGVDLQVSASGSWFFTSRDTTEEATPQFSELSVYIKRA